MLGSIYRTTLCNIPEDSNLQIQGRENLISWNVFARLNTGIMGSNPARGMDVCVYYVFVFSCVGSGLATGWSLVQGVLPTVYKCKITEPHKEEAKARYGLERHIRRRREREGTSYLARKNIF
jgi:hypothetical protein